MSTIVTGCATTATCINAYSTYRSTSERLEARGQRAFFRLCDTPEICYTVSQEIQDACDAGHLEILDCGKLVLNDPTENTATDDYGCADTTFVEDYSWSVDFFVRYHPDNEDFMDEICDGHYAEFGWVCCDNLVWIPPIKPEIAVLGPINDGGYKAWKITATWTQKCGTMRSIPARAPLALEIA